MPIRALFLAFAALAMSPALLAAPVTLVIEGETNSYSDTGNWLPFADPGMGSAWTLRLTYESDTTDLFGPDGPFGVPNDPKLGIYTNAITSFNLTIAGVPESFGLIESRTVLVLNDYDDQAGSWVDNWVASTSRTTFLGDPLPDGSGLTEQERGESIGMALWGTAPVGTPADPLTSDELVVPPGISAWEGGELYYSFRLRDNVTDTSETLARASATITSITVVPVPAAVWLFASGLIGLLGFTSRSPRPASHTMPDCGGESSRPNIRG